MREGAGVEAEQLRLIDKIDATAISAFPLFDRLAAQTFWRQALRQQTARAQVYDAAGRIAAIGMLLKNLATGVYASVNSGRIQLRSIVKDLTYIVVTFRPKIEPR
jgi:hypothetical protein